MLKPKYGLISKYFIPALSIKIMGALMVGFVYEYYYSGGDTYNYFYWGSKWVWEAFLDSPDKALKIIFQSASVNDPELYEFTSRMIFYGGGGAGFVSRLAGFFAIFTANTYSSIAILFSLICFVGNWYLFIILAKLFPDSTVKIAFAIFLLPSAVFWGSGLLKDTLTLAGVCYCFGAILRILYYKKPAYIILILGIVLIYKVKVYVLLCLVPNLGILVFQYLRSKIKSKKLRQVVGPVLIFISVVISIIGVRFISVGAGKYSLLNIRETAEATAWWHGYVSQEESGAGYTLGDLDYSIGGIVEKIIPAINVTLFRPYPWEINSLFMLLSSLESLMFFVLTIYVVIKIRVRDLYKKLSNPLILSLLLFSLTFAFAIGAVTYNFGALVRYKVPILPLYLIVLILLSRRDMPLEFKKLR